MIKQDIVNQLAKELNMKTSEAKPLVEGVIRCLKQSLESGLNIEISGFGKFVIRKKNPRMGRNPMTGEAAEITARKVVTFKASKLFRETINNQNSPIAE